MTVAPIKKADDLARLRAAEFLVQGGLYTSIPLEGVVEDRAVKAIIDATVGIFDCYCTTCGMTTPFICKPISVATKGGGLSGNDALLNPKQVYGARAVCQRDYNTYVFTFIKSDDKFIKIGQYPSAADIAFKELKAMEKGLDSTDRKELGTAIGLFAHGPAAGAFVYLRRVFERMIYRAYERSSPAKMDVVEFAKLRMDERIDLLRSELPERLVVGRKVFSLLSQGVHELSDDQCSQLFPVVKAVIFEMLEQEEHMRRKAEASRETEAAFHAILSSPTFSQGEAQG